MKTFILGTSIKISVVFADSVSSCKITIIDPYDTTKIDEKDMTLEDGTDNIYNYVWQSDDDNDSSGTYTVKVIGTNGAYTSVFADYFILKKVD